jgi:hypothetical protein
VFFLKNFDKRSSNHHRPELRFYCTQQAETCASSIHCTRQSRKNDNGAAENKLRTHFGTKHNLDKTHPEPNTQRTFYKNSGVVTEEPEPFPQQGLHRTPGCSFLAEGDEEKENGDPQFL